VQSVVGENVPHIKVSDLTRSVDQKLAESPFDIFAAKSYQISANGMIVVGVGGGPRNQEGATWL
jgi:hypothetical protein